MKLFKQLAEDRYKIFKSCLAYITFALVGGAATLLGSSLLDIQIRIQESFKVTSSLIPIRAVGYIIGASSSGLFEKFANDNLVLSFANFAAGIFLIAAPWFYRFILCAGSMFISGFAQGLLDIYCNLIILKIWGKRCANWLQILHMSFGIGALLTPVFTAPFVLVVPRYDDGSVEEQGLNATIDALLYSPEHVKVQYPYLILGGSLCLVAIPFLSCYLKERNDAVAEKEEAAVTNYANSSPAKIYGAVIITAIISNLCLGAEVLVGTLGPSFAVKSKLRMPKKTGVLLATVFWSMFSFYRIIFIPLTMIFKESRLVLFNVLIVLVSVVVMVPKAAYNTLYTWISFVLLGIGFSPLYANAYGSLNNYFEVSGKMTSVILVAGIVGESVHSSIVAEFLDTSPQVYVYYLGSMGLLYAIFCLILPIYCKKFLTKNEPSKSVELMESKV